MFQIQILILFFLFNTTLPSGQFVAKKIVYQAQLIRTCYICVEKKKFYKRYIHKFLSNNMYNNKNVCAVITSCLVQYSKYITTEIFNGVIFFVQSVCVYSLGVWVCVWGCGRQCQAGLGVSVRSLGQSSMVPVTHHSSSFLELPAKQK